MKKKLVVFGIVAIMLVSFAAGALVKYLSNTVTANIGVTSPIEVEWSIEPPEDVYGGDRIEFETKAKNQANRALELYNQLTTIETPAGINWEGTEFDAITVDNVAVPLTCVFYVKPDGSLDTWANIVNYNTNKARIWMDSNCDGVLNTYLHGAGSTATSNVKIDLNGAIAPTDYEIKVCYLFSMTGDCD